MEGGKELLQTQKNTKLMKKLNLEEKGSVPRKLGRPSPMRL